MSYDEMLDAWRAQDSTPLYSVSPGLLRVIVQQDQSNLRRQFDREMWFVPWMSWATAGAMLAMVFALLFVATRGWATPTQWDYFATGIGAGTMLLWPFAYMAIRTNHPPHDFGNSLQEEVQRSLSRVDDQLSRYGKLAPALFMNAPMIVAASLLAWVVARTNDGPSGWAISISFVTTLLLPMIWTGLYLRKRLLEHRGQLSQLLERLNANE